MFSDFNKVFAFGISGDVRMASPPLGLAFFSLLRRSFCSLGLYVLLSIALGKSLGYPDNWRFDWTRIESFSAARNFASRHASELNMASFWSSLIWYQFETYQFETI